MANVTFHIYNRNNTEVKPMVGYSLPFEIFKFEADWNSVPSTISDKKVIWNFGDNTTSTDLTGFHYYEYPGTYPVTLTVFDSTGDGSLSTYTSAIKISNYINDYIILTTSQTTVLTSGSVGTPIFLTRYNSYQTTLSARNSVINLSVSGNRSPYYTSEEYYKDKDAQFMSSARFLVDTDYGLTVVDEVSTTNDIIYATPNGANITLSLDSGTCVAGSSGHAYFYYVEDYKLR